MSYRDVVGNTYSEQQVNYGVKGGLLRLEGDKLLYRTYDTESGDSGWSEQMPELIQRNREMLARGDLSKYSGQGLRAYVEAFSPDELRDQNLQKFEQRRETTEGEARQARAVAGYYQYKGGEAGPNPPGETYGNPELARQLVDQASRPKGLAETSAEGTPEPTLDLPGGKSVLVKDWNELFEGMPEDQAARYQKIAIRDGLDAMNQVIEADNVEIVAGKAAAEVQQKQFEADNIKLADDKYMATAEWNKLFEGMPEDKAAEYQRIALRGAGFEGLKAAIDSDRAKRDAILSQMDTARYKKESGYDLAAFLRDNPGQEQAIKDTGAFTFVAVEEAKQFNKKYLGVGLPDLTISRSEFIDSYFKEQGWKRYPHRALATTAELKNFDKQLDAANDAYALKYGAPMTVDQFDANYFADKGWDHDINRGSASTTQLKTYDTRLTEATDAYIKKFGWEPVIQSACGKIADLIVPGVWLRDVKGMSTSEIALAAGIDALFLGIVMGKPLAGVARVAAKPGKIVFGAIAKTYGKAGDALAKIGEDAAQAVKKGQVNTLIEKANQLRVAGEAMRAQGLPGADRLIRNSEILLDKADAIITRGTYSGKTTVKGIIDSISSLEKQIATDETGSFSPWAKRLPEVEKGRVPSTVAVVPLSSEEARLFGITRGDIDRIASRTGNLNHDDWIREAKTIRDERIKALQKLSSDIEIIQNRESTLKSAKLQSEREIEMAVEKRKADARRRGLSEREAEAEAAQERARIDAETRRSDADQRLTRGREEQSMRQEAEERAAQKARDDKALVEKAKENEARWKALAERTVAEIAAMPVGRSIAFAQQETVADSLAAYNAQAFQRYLQGLSTTDRTRVMSQLSPAVRSALKQGNVTKAQQLAQKKVQTALQSATQTQTMLSQLTRQQMQSKQATLLKPAQLTKVTAKSEAQTSTKPTTATAVKAQVKPAVKPTPATKLAMATIKTPATKLAMATIKTPTPIPLPKKPIKPPEKIKEPKKDKEPPPRIILKTKKEIEAERKVAPRDVSAVAFKMGMTGRPPRPEIKIWRQPYKQVNLTRTNAVPAGVTVVSGKGSAAKTVTLLTGRPPKSPASARIGFQEVTVSKGGPRKVYIEFKPIQSMRPGNRTLRVTNQNRLRSEKVGLIYRTEMGKAVAYSRFPIGRRSRRKR